MSASDSSNQIRQATEDDRAAVERIVVAAYSHYIARIGREPGPMLDDYRKLIEAGHVRVLVANGTVCGVLVLIPEEDAMLLDNIAVDPSVKGQGFGKRLMLAAEEAAREAGYDAIRLYTHVMMTENIALYAKVGYVETHRGVEKGLNRVFMTKQL